LVWGDVGARVNVTARRPASLRSRADLKHRGRPNVGHVLQSLASDTILQLLRCFMLRELCILMPATKICHFNTAAEASRQRQGTRTSPSPSREPSWQPWPAFVSAETPLERVPDSCLGLRPEGCHADDALRGGLLGHLALQKLRPNGSLPETAAAGGRTPAFAPISSTTSAHTHYSSLLSMH
jgi:hypothetical protein